MVEIFDRFYAVYQQNKKLFLQQQVLVERFF